MPTSDLEKISTMKQHIFLLFLLVPILLTAQDRKAIREYKRAVKIQREILQANVEAGAPSVYLGQFEIFAERKEEQLKSGFDVALDPIESINFASAPDATGSWGETSLGINRRYKDIRDRAARDIAVFIFDTGAWTHTALEGVSWHEKDRMFTGEDSNEDKHSHSTHCAGIVAGADGVGIDPLVDAEKMNIISYKVLSNTGSGMYSWIETGIQEANKEAAQLIEDGYFVIYSFSLGGSGTNAAIEAALKAAQEIGVYVAAAAGNTGQEGTHYPGSSAYSVCVAALQQSGDGVSRASYSTYGKEVDIASPGSSILSTIPGNTYAYKSGTSMATPHQARLAAMVASVYPEANAGAVQAHLEKYALDLPPADRDEFTGNGWNPVDRLLDNEPGENPPPPDPDPDPDPDPEPEDCKNGKDDDGDGLIDCDDPDCQGDPDCYEEPDPEPPPIVKPARMYRATYPTKQAAYKVSWYESGVNVRHRLSFRITVEAESKQLMNVFADYLEKVTDKHFGARGYVLQKNSDYWDAAYWVAYFYDLIEGKEIGTLRVLKVDAVDDKGRAAILEADQLKDLKRLNRLWSKGAGNMSVEGWDEN